MRYVARITLQVEADDIEAVEEVLLNQVRNGIKSQCILEVARLPTEEQKQELSFKELLDNLNSSDMTKN